MESKQSCAVAAKGIGFWALKLSGDVAMRQRVLEGRRGAVADEEQFLADQIYGGQPRHDCTRIDLRNRFSERE